MMRHNFPHKLFLTNTKYLSILKAFVNVSSSNIRFSKTQLSKMVQLRGFLLLLDMLPIIWPMASLAKPLLKSSAKSISDLFIKELESKAPKSKKDTRQLFVIGGTNILAKKN